MSLLWCFGSSNKDLPDLTFNVRIACRRGNVIKDDDTDTTDGVLRPKSPGRLRRGWQTFKSGFKKSKASSKMAGRRVDVHVAQTCEEELSDQTLSNKGCGLPMAGRFSGDDPVGKGECRQQVHFDDH